MPTQNYRLKNGKRVSGVTTILNILAKPALIYWGYQQGLENYTRVTEKISGLLGDIEIAGMTGEDVLNEIREYLAGFQVGQLYEKRDKAGTAGTLGHLLVEHDIRGLPPPDLSGYDVDVVKKAEGSFLAFLEWKDRTRFKLIHSEVSLVSETFGFGGCLDVGVTGNLDQPELLDLKTAKDIYWSNWVQLGGYGILWDENHPDNKIKGYNILRIGDNGDFDHKHKESIDSEKNTFLYFNAIYKEMQQNGWKL